MVHDAAVGRVRITMLANESSTLGYEPLPQRILKQQLELRPCHSLAAWPMLVKPQSPYSPIVKGHNGGTTTQALFPIEITRRTTITLGKWSFR